MTTLGSRAAIDLVTPTGIDGGKVFEFEIMGGDGKTAGQVVAEAAAAVGAVNEELTAEYGNVLSFTTDTYAIDRQGEGASTMTPQATEFTAADEIRSNVIGHMYRINHFEDALGWTERYLKHANMGQLQADIQLLTERFRNRFDYDFITRILTDTENAIGSAGYDVGWAVGSGDNVNYLPPQYKGVSFTSSHLHYLYKDDTSVDYNALFDSMAGELRHHGIRGRLVCLTSDNATDLAEIMALTNFVLLKPSEVVFVGGNSSSPVSFAEGEFEGVPGDVYGFYRSPTAGLIELRSHPRIPTNYCWMTRPSGQANINNGAVIRLEAGVPFGLTPAVEIDNHLNPRLKKISFGASYAVNVKNRLNGVAGYIAASASAWVNPSIT